ncbi:hypothetical protein D3C73_1331620 [compost metagenome]
MPVGDDRRAAAAASAGDYIFLFVQIKNKQAAVVKGCLFHGNAFFGQQLFGNGQADRGQIAGDNQIVVSWRETGVTEVGGDGIGCRGCHSRSHVERVGQPEIHDPANRGHNHMRALHAAVIPGHNCAA